jgi:hypothetical protein
MFMLVSRCYQRASLIVTTNKPQRCGARAPAALVEALHCVEVRQRPGGRGG